MLIVGTALYKGQGPDWYYLIPEIGQHVFLWSQQSHQWVAQKYGYYVLSIGDRITVYLKHKPSVIDRLLLQLMAVGTKIFQMLIPVLPHPGMQADKEARTGSN